ncbi:hypothetical protein VTO73DRAFT_13009 [Trametes versicolor]
MLARPQPISLPLLAPAVTLGARHPPRSVPWILACFALDGIFREGHHPIEEGMRGRDEMGCRGYRYSQRARMSRVWMVER